MKFNIVIVLALLLSSNAIKAQFSNQTGIALGGVKNGSIAWGDYDNDGDLDILLTGFTGSSNISKIYQNNGNNSFSEQTGIVLTGVSNSSVAWGDYDNDGDLDILLAGYTGSANVSKIYKNNGNNSFSEQNGITLTGVDGASVAWGDYDNDADLDILLTGNTGSNNISKIYQNNGNNNFIEQTNIFLTGISGSSVDWGDYDNDGNLDILMAGYNMAFGNISKIYKNNGNNSFSEQTAISLTAISGGSVDWGDYDSDGDLDILLTGSAGFGNPISKIYKNNGNSSFTELTALTLLGVDNSSAAWGDYDNDGDLDFLLTGYNTTSYNITKLYKNNGNDNFSLVTGTSFSGVYFSSVAWGDYDNDNDLDIILTGNQGANNYSKIYKNNATQTNNAPTKPTSIFYNNTLKTVFWNHASDDFTSPKGLSYNLMIGSINNPDKIKASHSLANTGKRKLASMGNIQLDTFCSISNFSSFRFDEQYIVKVQAVDNAFLGSTFSDSLLLTFPPLGSLDTHAIQKVCGDTAQLILNVFNGSIDSLSYLWSPSTGLSSSTIHNPIAKPSQSTWYKITATSSYGLTLIDSVFVQINPMNVNAGPDIVLICGDSVYLNPSTNYPAAASNLSWTWSPNSYISNAYIKNPQVAPITSHAYSISINSIEGCYASDTMQLTINPLTANAGSDKTIMCRDTAYLDSVITNYSGYGISYSWSPLTGLNSATSSHPYTTSLGLTYTITVSTTNGCHAYDSVTINSMALNSPEICILGIDSNNKNRIIWNKPNSQAIDSIYIYRETNVAGIYTKIGASTFTSPAVFVDNTSNPDIQSEKYKISVLDSCGIESAQSPHHKTMHLTINQGIGSSWNLIWNTYEGFAVSTYNIFRGSTQNNMQLIGSVSGGNNQYSDLSATTAYVYYQVEVISPNSCDNTKTINSSKSNIATNFIDYISESTKLAVTIYPNPFTNELIIETEEKPGYTNFELVNALGQTVDKGEIIDKAVVKTSHLSEGIFFIKIIDGETIQTRKIIKK